MTKERVTEIVEKLDELQKFCLIIHRDSISFQICELLKEIVMDIILEDTLEV